MFFHSLGVNQSEEMLNNFINCQILQTKLLISFYCSISFSSISASDIASNVQNVKVKQK